MADNIKKRIPTAEEISVVMSFVASHTSERKAEAARINGASGGRPKKDPMTVRCNCGRVDSLDGHPTTCPRGKLLRERERLAQAEQPYRGEK
jgi:hypothetical protein